MKLKTSSFKTVFRKDLFRFAPLWALYFIGGLMVTLAVVNGHSDIYRKVEILNAFLLPMGVINLIYAPLCAQVLFGDLFNSRLCNALHALPLRREVWFLSHVAAGLCYSLVPHLVVMLLVGLGMGGFWFVPLLWIAVSALEFLFFFGVAVLSCMCTGNRVAMLLVYAIINFISVLTLGFIQLVYMPQFFGLELDGELFLLLCPVTQLVGNPAFFGFDTYAPIWNMVFSQLIEVFRINWSAWIYPAILAGVGIAALGLALLLYRRRALESAGDFVAIRILDPVFTVIYTLSVGAVFALLGNAILDFYIPWLLLGLAVGYFTSRMFLGRTVRVFQKRNFLYCGLFMAAMGLSIGLAALDPLGVTRWTPEPASVSEVTVQGHSTLTLTEQEEIEKVIAMHKLAIAAKGKGDFMANTTIIYTLKDGRVFRRNYDLTMDQLELLRSEYSAPEHLLGYEDWDQYLAGVRYIRVRNLSDKREQVIMEPAAVRSLLEALRKDCEAGIMAQDWYLRYGNAIPGYSDSYTIDIYAGGDDVPQLMIYRYGQTTAWIKENVDFSKDFYT